MQHLTWIWPKVREMLNVNTNLGTTMVGSNQLLPNLPLNTINFQFHMQFFHSILMTLP